MEMIEDEAQVYLQNLFINVSMEEKKPVEKNV